MGGFVRFLLCCNIAFVCHAHVVCALTGDEAVVEIGAGASHMLARTASGAVWFWGKSVSAAAAPVALPTRVEFAADEATGTVPTIVQVCTTGQACLALTSDGAVLGWGIGALGEGDETVVPTAVPSVASLYGPVVQVSTALTGGLCVAVTASGFVVEWAPGSAAAGAVMQTAVPPFSRVARISAGVWRHFAILGTSLCPFFFARAVTLPQFACGVEFFFFCAHCFTDALSSTSLLFLFSRRRLFVQANSSCFWSVVVTMVVVVDLHRTFG